MPGVVCSRPSGAPAADRGGPAELTWLRYTAAVKQVSEHAAAAAITDLAVAESIPLASADDFAAFPA